MAMSRESTVANRLRRQDHDDGHPADVVVRANRSTSDPSAYHERRDCMYFGGERRQVELTRSQAQAERLAPCWHCVLEWEGRDTGMPKRDRCPACGRTLGDCDIPQHMRSGECEGVA